MKFHVFAILLVGCLCGCVSMRKPVVTPDGSRMPGADPEPGKEIALGNRILKTIQERSYADFAKVLGGRTTLEVSRKDFQTSYGNLEKQFGEITGYRYVLELKTPMVRNLVWVVTFQRRDKTAVVSQEMLFRLVTGVMDGEIKVMGMGFF